MNNEDVILNLKDAKCDNTTIKKFIAAATKAEKLKILLKQREVLLNAVHKADDELYCLDYFIDKVRKSEG